MFGIEKDLQNLMEQVYGPLGKKEQMTEIEEVKAQIKVLEKKLSFLEEIEKQPRMNLQREGEYAVVSYHDKVYYRLMNETTFSWYKRIVVIPSFPTPTLVMVDDAETERLLEGLYYNHIQVKKEKEQRVKDAVRESVKWCEEHPDKDPLDWLKPQTPEQVADGLKEAFREAVKQGVVSSSTKTQNLTDLIYDWWDEIFMNNNEAAVTIESLVDDIEKWLPKEQSAAGSQNAYVECSVEGFNDCLNKIRRKLR